MINLRRWFAAALIAATFLTPPVFAQSEGPDSPAEIGSFLISGGAELGEVSAPIELKVQPDNWDLIPGERPDLGLLTSEIESRKTPEFEKRATSELIVPIAPSETGLLSRYAQLTPAQQDLFHARQRWILTKLGSGLRALRLPLARVSGLLLHLNDQLYVSAGVVAARDVQGMTLQLNIPVGLAAPDYLLGRLRELPLGSLIPRRLGFYFAVGGGLVFARVQTERGPRFRIEVYRHFQRLESVKTFVAIAGVTSTISFIMETRGGDPEALARQVLRINDLPGFAVRQGPGHFSAGLGPGLTAPPFVQGFSVFQANESRVRMLSFDVPNLNPMALIRRWSRTHAAAPLCSAVFAD